MNNEEIARFYDALVETHGYSHLALDYGIAESQRTKFRVLSKIMPLNEKTVLDVGCGFADFYDYIIKIYPSVKYTGIDISTKALGWAKALHPDVDLRLNNIVDMKQKFDVVVANGIFYLLGHDALLAMKNIIKIMFDLANEAIVFTSLSTWAIDKKKNEFHAKPIEILKFCRTLTPHVVLRSDYHSRDFTMYMYKKQNI